MPKYRITDPAWVGEVLGGAFFLAEKEGQGRYEQQAGKVRQVLGLPAE